MATLLLDGCRLEPLGSYLKALGVLRLVGTQLDPAARGWWSGDRFALDADVDIDALERFLLDDYRPTPLLSPWNGGSGFGTKDKESARTVAAVEATEHQRFEPYRRAIAVVRRLAAAPDWPTIGKETQVTRLRNELPDEAIPWIDAAIVITGRAKPTFAPLFISGGNDGRFEFSANFMARLLEATGNAKLGKGLDRDRWLRSALRGGDSGPLLLKSFGPYDPGAGGGINSAAVGDAGAQLNPWDFVLTFEGGLMFASGAARRMGSEISATAAVPFSVETSRLGPASVADGEGARAEIWAPYWRRPATFVEVARLIGEGRAEWRGRNAANGVDFARAAATLAVDRGIAGFVRHGLLVRFGTMHLAVGLDRVRVGDRPEVRVTRDVDEWVHQVSDANAPAALRDALRRLDRALYAAATRGRSSAPALQDVLVELAGVEAAIARSSKRDERARQPVNGLDAREWYKALDDHTVEFRLAAAMASARDVVPRPSGGGRSVLLHSALSLLVRPVVPDRQQLAWAPGPPAVDGWGRRPVLDTLLDALAHRAVGLVAGDADLEGPGQRGIRLGFARGVEVPLDDIVALFDGRVDEGRLGRLLEGLVLLDWRKHKVERAAASGVPTSTAIPPILAAVAPLLTGSPVRWNFDDGWADVDLRAASWWPAALASGQVDRVTTDALHRLRIARLDPAPRLVAGTPTDGPRLAAVAFCRLDPADGRALLRQTCPKLPVS